MEWNLKTGIPKETFLQKTCRRFMDYAFVATHPSWWIQVSQIDEDWDKFLRFVIENEVPLERVGQYTCYIGHIEIWIENYNHSYARHFKAGLLPYRRTGWRFQKYLKSQNSGFNQFIKQARISA